MAWNRLSLRTIIRVANLILVVTPLEKEAKVKMGVLRRFTSVFVDRGGRVGPVPSAARERQQFHHSAPWWTRKLSFAFIGIHRAKRLLAGIYRQEPFDYSIYTLDCPEKRLPHHVAKPVFLWKNRI